MVNKDEYIILTLNKHEHLCNELSHANIFIFFVFQHVVFYFSVYKGALIGRVNPL